MAAVRLRVDPVIGRILAVAALLAFLVAVAAYFVALTGHGGTWL